MNKKALTVKVIIIAIVIAAVLFIVVLSLINYFPSLANRFGILVPTLNFTTPNSEIAGMIRYNVLTKEAEYSDGIEFYKFEKGEAKINNKIFSETEVKNAFVNKYFNRADLPSPISLKTPQTFYKEIKIESIDSSNGDTKILCTFYDKTQIATLTDYLILTIDDKLLSRSSSGEITVGAIGAGTNHEIFINRNIETLGISPEITAELNKLHLMSISPLTGDKIITFTGKKITLSNEYTLTKIGPAGEPSYPVYYVLEKNEQPTQIYFKATTTIINLIVKKNEHNNFAEISQQNFGSSEKEIVTETIKWRDSVLNQPIEIPARDAQTRQPATPITVCLLKQDNYLALDFSKTPPEC